MVLSRNQRTAAVLLALTTGQTTRSAEFFAVWTDGGSNGFYADVSNWDLGVVPCNDKVDTYNVTIVTTGDVFMNVDDACTVTDLVLGASQRFRVGSGHTFTVLDDATINGTVIAENSSFLAEGTGASFGDDQNATLIANGGGVIAIAATVYSSAGIPTDQVLFDVSGSGTLIDLSSLQTINAGFQDSAGNVRRHLIEATASATIDLSSVQTLIGPVRVEDRLDLVMTSDGNIPLPALQEIRSSFEGNVRFDLSVPSYTLNALLTASDAEFLLRAGTDLTLPLLTDVSRSIITLPGDASVSAPRLLAIDGSTVSVAPDGVFSAPLCDTFTGSTLTLEAGQTVILPRLVNMNHSSFTVRDGVTFTVAAASYDSGGTGAPLTILDVDGTDTVVDWSTVQTISAGFNDNNDAAQAHVIAAGPGTRIDLSGISTLVGPFRDEDRLDIVVTDADVPLTALTEVRRVGTGRVRLTLNVPSYTLPAFSTAAGLELDLRAGCVLDLPALVDLTDGRLDVPAGASISAPALRSIDSAVVSVLPGGALSAPLADTFTRSVLTAEAGQTLMLPALLNIDNSTFDVRGGVTFQIAATGYASSGLVFDLTVVNAQGAGTRVDWSTVQLIDARFNDNHAGIRHHRLVARDDAVLDLSSLQSVLTPFRSEDALAFTALTGATLDLRALAGWSGTGRVVFTAHDPGTLLDLSSFTTFDQDAALAITSAAEVRLADLGVGVTGTFTTDDDASGYPRVRVGGSVRNEIQDETAFRIGDAKLTATSSFGTFEAASEDLGATAPVPDTFEFGELTYTPAVDGTSFLIFVDNFDNGNRAGEMPETIYFTGHDGENGIQSLGGGTLVLRNLNVYALIDDAWINLQDLTPDVGTVAFLDGFLTNSKAALAGDVNVDMAVDFDDLRLILAHWGSGNPFYDLDADRDVGVGDLLVVLAHWGRVTL